MIIQTGDNTFTATNNRGTSWTVRPYHGSWLVESDNAAVRAYRTSGAKVYPSLRAIEEKIKAFRGISQLVEA